MISLFRKQQRPSIAPTAETVPAFPADLVDPRVMNQIGHLEVVSRTVVDGLLAGKHRSTTKGGCCEFAQHRQYAPGDEIRQIDWLVYARNALYMAAQVVSTWLLGLDEFSMRLPSVLFGVGSVAVVYALGKTEAELKEAGVSFAADWPETTSAPVLIWTSMATAGCSMRF